MTTASALNEILVMMYHFEKNPPAWENNSVIPDAIKEYLATYDDGIANIEVLAMNCKPSGFLCDMVQSLGDVDGGARCTAALQRLLTRAPSVAIRDSAMLALLTLELPDTASQLRRALQTEQNKMLRADMETALRDIEEEASKR